MADGKIIFQTELDDKGLKKGLSDSESAMKSTGAKGSKAFSSAVKAGTVAAGAAVAKIGYDSVKAYSEYEQLVGGVDTLFKDSSKQVQEYAANAYKTAGLSANEYMEQATSFSAALLNSLGGDTEKAAKYTDMAITDMSDNANKMGTDIGRIQDAYQGFAKQNYTMLDNLKLGYGGTKSEMERLLSDAEEITGKKYDLSNLNDVFDAIHAIQTKYGVTGTTAKEAEETIQGSFSMMKASWENLLVAMSDPDADIGKVLDQFVESVGTFAKNVLPQINQFAKSIGAVIVALAPELMNLIGQLLPTLVKAVADLIVGVAQSIPTLAVLIIQAVGELIPQIISVITTALPQVLTAITTAIPQILTAVSQAIPQIVTAITTALPQIILAITNAFPQIVTAILQSLPQIIAAITTAIPQIIIAIADALPLIVQCIAEMTPQIVQAVSDCFPQIVMAIVSSLPLIMSAILQALPQIITALLQIQAEILSLVVQIWAAIAKSCFELAKQAVNKIKSGLGSLSSIARNWISSLLQGIRNSASSVLNYAFSFAKSLPQKIKSGLGSLYGVGRDFVQGLWNGLKDKFSSVIDWARNAASQLPDAIKYVLGIASPSKVAQKEIGWMWNEGLMKGIGEGTAELVATAKEQVADMMAVYSLDTPQVGNVLSGFTASRGLTGYNDNTTQSGGNSVVNQTINFNQPVQTPAQTARELKRYDMYGMVGV